MGSGVAFLDYDNDGWQDILIVNGMDWPGHAGHRSTLIITRRIPRFITTITTELLLT